MVIPDHSDKRHFDTLECCALAHAAVHQEDWANGFLGFLGEKKLRALNSIFTNTIQMGFIPSGEIAQFYTALAQQEVQWLGVHPTAPRIGSCTHRPEDHIRALVAVLLKLNEFLPRVN